MGLAIPKKTNFLSTAKPADEIPEGAFIKAIIYGRPGVGKTSLACQADNPILIDIDRGSKSLKTMGLGHVPVVRPETVADIEGIFWEAKANPAYYATYIVDTVSALQRFHLDELIDKAVLGGKRSEIVNTQPDYNESTNVIRRIAMQFRELPCNLILIAQAAEDKDEASGSIVTRPALTPKLAGTLDEMVDLVGYLDLEASGMGANQTYKRTLRTLPTRRINAKNRLGLPAVIEDPTWDKITGLAAVVSIQAKEKKTVSA